MIRSMTGYARGELATDQGILLWELRAVNNRYLEVLLKLPESFRPLEGELRQLATSRLGRGRVEASLSVRRAESAGGLGALNMSLARQLMGHAKTLAAEMGGGAADARLDPLDLLRYPGVLEHHETAPDALFPQARQLFDATLADLAGAREREGARLAEMFERRLTEIEARVVAVEQRLPEVLQRIRERLAERIASLGVTVEPERVAQEVALIAQKMDVSEELDRLRSHMTEFRHSVGTGGAVGRRLDFLVQEFNREANTLASKSADADTTRQAVDIKVLVEQIREQVQNVE
jgi:uncharacterized protein (TIGR00255 family)